MRISIIVFLLLSSLLAHAHIKVLNPIGGEMLEPGEVLRIEWEILITHDTQNWDIYFSRDNGTTWETIVMNLSVDSLAYNWTIPTISASTVRVKVVQDNVNYDYEDISELFSIGAVAGIEINKDEQFFYPNPSHNSITFYFTEPRSSYAEIMTLTGQRVSYFKPTQKREVFQHNLPTSMYIVRVIKDGVATKAKRLVVQ